MNLLRNPFASGYEPTFDRAADLRQRLAWLYGDPEARKTANAGDVEAWRGLGTYRNADRPSTAREVLVERARLSSPGHGDDVA